MPSILATSFLFCNHAKSSPEVIAVPTAPAAKRCILLATTHDRFAFKIDLSRLRRTSESRRDWRGRRLEWVRSAGHTMDGRRVGRDGTRAALLHLGLTLLDSRLTDRSCSGFWHGEGADRCSVARSRSNDCDIVSSVWSSAFEWGRWGHFLVGWRALEVTMVRDRFVVGVIVHITIQQVGTKVSITRLTWLFLVDVGIVPIRLLNDPM